MVEASWKAEFTIAGLDLARDFIRDGLELMKDKKVEGTVRGVYRFKSSNFSDDAEMLARKQIDDLLNVLITGANLGFYSDFPEITDFRITCDNIEDVVRTGGILPSYLPRETAPPVSIDSDSLGKYFDGAKKLRASGYGNVYENISTLLRAGLTASDEYAKFFGIWRSFNAFYNHLDPISTNEVDRIQTFAKSALDTKTAQSIIDLYNKPSISGWGPMQQRLLMVGCTNVFDMLVKANLTSEKGTINYSTELAKCIGTSTKPLEVLRWALLCLYSVRNTVLHGARYSYREADFLYLCSLLLQEVSVTALNVNFIRKYCN